MTERLREQQSGRSASVQSGVDSSGVNRSGADGPGVRVLLGVAAIAAGMTSAWLTSGSVAALAGMAVLLAAANGYGKAYSP